ncbi:advillin-like [Lineus longissimus]|uniref:advillin-like n=1 Tax=Lineus longissimus TaxID=88925 RepID=UPI002B4E813D
MIYHYIDRPTRWQGMMAFDAAFDGAGQKPGLEIWRIEKLKVVRQDPKTYGQFFSGDSYICLMTKKPPKKDGFEWDIHFWLGKETSQDEAGIAAYKTVELDESLGGAPVQHREVQEHESPEFVAYFKKGISYMEGGIDSGFKKVDRNKYDKRLLQLKGRRTVRTRQVELSFHSLNVGDVFILDCGLELFTWFGPESSRVERMKGLEVARQIRDDQRGGKAEITIIEPEFATTHVRFYEALGTDVKTEEVTIRPASDGGDDVDFEKEIQAETKLHRVCDSSGQTEIHTIDKMVYTQKDLDTEDCFILEAGKSGIFVWVGKGCTDNEKKSAWKLALDFLDSKGYPKWTQCTRVVEDGETPLFKQCFKNWRDKDAQEGFGKVHNVGSIAKVEQEKFDVNTLHTRKEKDAVFMPDDGHGLVQVWRIEDFQLSEIPDDMYGIFFGGDSYVILYSYFKKGKKNPVIYYWQGTMSSKDEKAAAAMLAQDMFMKEFDGMAEMFIAPQNKEPEHFLKIFKGKMIVYKGGTASGFKNRNEIEEEDKDENMLFQVRGTNAFNTRAVQVPCHALSLNSNDVFILKSGKKQKTLIWIGAGANAEEKEMSVTVARGICNGQQVIKLEEGVEVHEFWEALGGKAEYATGTRLKDSNNDTLARLFQCSNASGKIMIEEILDFAQEDLNQNDVMILDAFDQIFVWVGSGARDFEKKEALEAAIEYLGSEPTGRTEANTELLHVKQGHEPLDFTVNFHAWDSKKFAAMEQTIDNGQSVPGAAPTNAESTVYPVTTVREELAKYNAKHPYERLSDPDQPLPEGVDELRKEHFLTDEEFEVVFGMTKDEFDELKPWKQTMLKKQKLLF